jgi:metallo-beta-lactamase family protein
MNIEFYGAAGCVTGSCHILRIRDKTILLDCGMFQGKEEKERGNEKFIFNSQEIDYVLLSHAHIDHSGRIPLLYKQGFKGKVICSEATKDLCSVMLPDSGHIQEMEIEWKNRKRARQGLDPLEPLYDAQTAMNSMKQFIGYSYNEWIELFEGCRIRFLDAGHLLGSAIIEIAFKETGEEKEKLIVYTGDLGNIHIPIINDPTNVDYCDYLIMETTYGDRLHKSISAEFSELANIIKETFRRGGNVIIPSFAVGRSQEVLYAIDEFIESNELKNIPIFLDSPLSAEATEIFNKHSDIFDEETKTLIKKGVNPLKFKDLIFVKSAEESIKLNKKQSGAVIISASGMCEAGRIKHHLKHNLWRKECSVVFVGYQAEGTLGRAIVEGARKVKIFGEEIAVNAKIYNFEGLSGHADRMGLLNWLQSFKRKPEKVFLVHGDKKAQESFNELLKSKGYSSSIMQPSDKFTVGSCSNNESTTKVKKKIIDLLDSIEDIENVDKEELLNKIRKVII